MTDDPQVSLETMPTPPTNTTTVAVSATPPAPNTSTCGFALSADKERGEMACTMTDATQITPEMAALKDAVETTLVTLHVLFPNPASRPFRHYFDRLLSLAQVGLTGTHPLPPLAQHSLTMLKNEIVAQEAPAIRMRYLNRLGIHALAQASISAILVMVLHHFEVFDKDLFSTTEIVNCGILWIGCMAGVWLSVGMDPPATRFECLQHLASDSMEPSVRLIFTGLLAIFVALLLNTGVVTIQLGLLSTETFLSDFKISLILGMLCGLGEKALSTTVSQRVDQFMDGLNKKA